jgi:hypothetical protein
MVLNCCARFVLVSGVKPSEPNGEFEGVGYIDRPVDEPTEESDAILPEEDVLLVTLEVLEVLLSGILSLDRKFGVEGVRDISIGRIEFSE